MEYQLKKILSAQDVSLFLVPSACAEPDYSGDGICDDQNNNADCDFDGGDCCGPHVDKTFCIKCECLENNQESDENFLDFFRSLSHVPQYHPEPEYR